MLLLAAAVKDSCICLSFADHLQIMQQSLVQCVVRHCCSVSTVARLLGSRAAFLFRVQLWLLWLQYTRSTIQQQLLFVFLPGCFLPSCPSLIPSCPSFFLELLGKSCDSDGFSDLVHVILLQLHNRYMLFMQNLQYFCIGRHTPDASYPYSGVPWRGLCADPLTCTHPCLPSLATSVVGHMWLCSTCLCDCKEGTFLWDGWLDCICAQLW